MSTLCHDCAHPYLTSTAAVIRDAVAEVTLRGSRPRPLCVGHLDQLLDWADVGLISEPSTLTWKGDQV